MRTRLLLFSAAVALVACGRVLFDQSNAFPCDFSQPAGTRDLACAPGDVCGVDDRCQRYVNEGPRFEGAATLPDFSPDSGAGDVIHPLLVEDPALVVAQFPTALPMDRGDTWLTSRFPDGGPKDNFIIRPDGRVVEKVKVLLPLQVASERPVQFIPLRQAAARPELESAAVVTDAGVLWLLDDPNAQGIWARQDRLGSGVTRARAVAMSTPDLALAYITQSPARVSVTVLGNRSTTTTTLDAGTVDAGEPVDVGWVSRRDLQAAIVLDREGFWLWQDPSWRVKPLALAPHSLTRLNSEPAAFDVGAQVRVDPTGSVVSVTFQSGPLAVDVGLSTWQLSNAGGEWALRRLWSDCAPCPRPAHTVAATPVVTGKGAAVDALCAMGTAVSMVRVTGSAAADAMQACVVEPLPLPIAPRFLTQGDNTPAAVLDPGQTAGVTVAGNGGQLWSGESLGTLMPMWLERVPTEVDLLSPTSPREGDGRLLVLTNTYLARMPFSFLKDRNGFTRLGMRADLSYLGGIDMPTALVRGGQGWVLLPTGDLATLSEPDAGSPLVNRTPEVRFGPRLVDGVGQPLSSAEVALALTAMDGGVLSAVVASGDSLSFVALNQGTESGPGMMGDVSPQLTPEPGTRIRSVAVEMTPIGTNGVDKVKGYLVTSRSLFRFELSGKPPRWSATPIPLAAGEPLEVWMDNPRGGLGRVGYRDGAVFTLPGGFQLVEALPAADGGAPPQVYDYENLGGWPVAYTSMGLYVAKWDDAPGGGVESHFPDGGVNRPMTWRKVTLPKGGEPWMSRQSEAGPAKLYVQVGPQLQDGGVYSQTFTLLVFMGNKVQVAGQHVRTNKSARTE